MPQGIPSIKQLDKLVTAALAQALAGQSSSAPTQNKYSFLSDPTFLQAIAPGGGIGPGPAPTGRQGNSAPTAAVSNLEASVNRIGFQKHHQSIFGRILDVMSRPMYATAEAGREGLESVVKGKGVGNTFGAMAHGALQGVEGKKKTDWTDVLTEAGQLHHLGKQGMSVQDAFKALQSGKPVKSDIGKWTSAGGGLAADIFLDPTTYVGTGAVAKVRNLERTPETLAKLNKVEETLRSVGKTKEADLVKPTFLGGQLKEGKLYKTKALPNSAQRAQAVRNATTLSRLYGNISFQKLLKDSEKVAEEELKKQGIRRYDNLEQMRKSLKGDATETDLNHWNYMLDHQIKDRASELAGSKVEHVSIKSSELLDLATRNSLAGSDVSKQIEKRLALNLAGKPVASVKLPESFTKAVKTAAMSDKVKKVRDPIVRTHDLVNTVFRTGSHIDPLVNAMRMARHSSVVDKVNNHVINLKSIWGHVSPENRKSIANAVSQGKTTGIKIAGGHDLNAGKDVENLVEHTKQEMERIQSLVGNHDGALSSFEELNSHLPGNFKMPERFKHDPNWLQNAWREHYLNTHAANSTLQKMAEDPATFLHIMQRALLASAGNRELKEQIVQRFGHHLKGLEPSKVGKNAKDPAVKLLVDKHGYRAPMWQPKPGAKKQIIKGYEDHVFHPDVARGIEAMHTMMATDARFGSNIATNQIHKLFNDATQMFKSVVTKFNPGFHERNLIGEIANGAADGVVNPKWYRQSLQVLRLHGRQALDTGEEMGKRGARVHNAIMPDSYEAARIQSIKGTDHVIKKRFTTVVNGKREPMHGVTADAIWHAYVATGLKTGWITTEFGKVAAPGAARRALRGVNSAAQHWTENIEDYARLAHFISRIERSHLRSFEEAAEEAASYVRKYHFDYNDFTNIEKNFISRAIPFYKWTRKNIPLQLALAFQKPGYMLSQMKALNAVSELNGYRRNGNVVPDAGEVMPLWLRDALAVPVGQGSSGTRYLDAPLPTRDAFKFFGEGIGDTTTNAFYMLNPFVKDPIELKTGHQIGGAPIQNDRYFAAMTPYTNLLHNLGNSNNTGKSTNLLQFLLGLGLVENTPARMKSELKREQSEGSARRKKYRTSHGALPVGGRS